LFARQIKVCVAANFKTNLKANFKAFLLDLKNLKKFKAIFRRSDSISIEVHLSVKSFASSNVSSAGRAYASGHI